MTLPELFHPAGRRRRAVAPALAALCLVAAAWAGPAAASEVVILKSADLTAYNQAVAGFKSAMPPSTTFTEYDMQGDMAHGKKIARKIRASDATLLLAVGVKAALLARLEIVDIPVVFCMVLDPVRHDLKAPNMTGISLDVPIERQFRTMRSVLPPLKRIGVLYDPEKTGNLVEEARPVARAMGFDLIEREVRTEKDVPAVLRAILPKIEAVWLIPDGTVLTEDSLKFVMGTTLDSNVPVIGFSSELVHSGALVGLSVNYGDVGRQAGSLARRVLGEPVRPLTAAFPPERLRLSLNLKTARFLGIVIPPDVVNNADELY